MDSDEAPAVPRGSRRVAVAAEVRLEFERFTGFLEEMASNLSEGGMFVRTRNLRPVGSRLRFEIVLSDQWPLVRGTGEVMWTRWRDGGPQERAGMGIRFERLDSQSRELVERVVVEQRRAGRSPFDLDAAAPPPGAAEPEPENWFDLASRRDTESLVVMPAPSATGGPRPAVGPAATAASQEPGLEEFRSWLAPSPPSFEAPAAPVQPELPAQEGRSSTAWAAAPSAPPRSSQRRGLLLLIGATAAVLVSAGVWMALRGSGKSADPPDGDATSAAAPALVVEPRAPTSGSPAASTATAAAPQSAPDSAAAAVTPQAAANPFTTLERITWEDVAGGTLVTLWLDGTIARDAVRHSRLGPGGAREVLQLRGARRAFQTPRLEVGNAQLARIRTGFHQRQSGDEQHVVLDLAGPSVRLLDLEVEGSRIRVRLGAG